MSKPKMSADQLSECRKRLEQRWKSRIVDEGLLHRAWQVAHEVATLLYEQFGATRVAVFGSLTEPMSFTSNSDIDIAVWGLSQDLYDKAYSKIINFDSGFKIDIINFDISKGIFRERVQHQAIPIEKNMHVPTGMTDMWRTLYKHLQQQVFPANDGEIYEMNRKRLTQRSKDELTKISETLERIARGLEKLEVVPTDVREFIENTIATDLADVYRGIENIFLRIAREVDTHVPTGSRWHKNLLAQMGEQRPERPSVISENTAFQLEKLLEFRHTVTNIYGRELVYEKTVEHAKSIDELFTIVSQEFNAFTDALAKREEEV